MGTFDAIVVHADNGATEFFKKEGFHDDLVINSQYKTLSDRWTNCTLMCYMPPFVGNTVGSEQEVKAIQGEVEKWRTKSLEAYQALATAMARLNQEVNLPNGLPLKRKEKRKSFVQTTQTYCLVTGLGLT